MIMNRVSCDVKRSSCSAYRKSSSCSSICSANKRDGKIYTGQVTFTASRPIEVEVIHIYRPDQTSDEAHGQPPTAVINGTTITYSHLTSIVDNNIIIGDVPTASGTFEFTGSGLVFHKRSLEPFTVIYTIDATVGQLTQ
jgi:hypothetical protein